VLCCGRGEVAGHSGSQQLMGCLVTDCWQRGQHRTHALCLSTALSICCWCAVLRCVLCVSLQSARWCPRLCWQLPTRPMLRQHLEAPSSPWTCSPCR
jgi:hypothetical protein